MGALGVLAGLLRVLEASAAGDPDPVSWARAVGGAGFLVLAYALAGRAAYVLCRVAATVVAESLERGVRRSEMLATESARVAGLLEKIGGVLAQRIDSGGAATVLEQGRLRSLAEIGQSIRGERWVEAEASLEVFEIEYPGDSRSAVLRAELAAARQGVIDNGLAQLEAARSANDPDRVLELYRALASSVTDEVRGPLEHDLSTWFLNLIHRRLRLGKIQADVVSLAGRFAEAFATTAQGASVHAALPTLRRSVGLCPRCAQPYTGIADACPQCLGLAAGPSVSVPVNPESTPTD
jgi:hypothetical protein